MEGAAVLLVKTPYLRQRSGKKCADCFELIGRQQHLYQQLLKTLVYTGAFQHKQLQLSDISLTSHTTFFLLTVTVLDHSISK